MTPSWYDVLGVEPDADAEAIRASFRATIADLDPTDRRFKLASRAAEVLLDETRRAAYDAELAAAEVDELEETDGEEVVEEAPTLDLATIAPPVSLRKPRAERTRPRITPTPKDTVPVVAASRPTPRRSGRVPALVAGVVALALVAAVVVSLVAGDDTAASDGTAAATSSSDLPDDQQIAAARAAAEAAIVPVLSYDYRHLPEDKTTALSYLTPAFAEEYGKIFDGLIDENSPTTRTVVQAKLLASGISRTGEGRVDVVVFVDQVTTNREVTADDPIVYKNQAIAQMVDTGGTWLLDCLVTEPGGGCDH